MIHEPGTWKLINVQNSLYFRTDTLLAIIHLNLSSILSFDINLIDEPDIRFENIFINSLISNCSLGLSVQAVLHVILCGRFRHNGCLRMYHKPFNQFHSVFQGTLNEMDLVCERQ